LENRLARPVQAERCIECGACAINCPVEAIQVDSGPGCFVALINAALYGGEPTCGPRDDGSQICCGDTRSGDCC